MSSLISSTTKLRKAIHGRLAFFETVAEVTKPLSRKREKLVELIKEKASLVGNSSIGQKLKVAKEYAVVEMSPPKLADIPKMKADLTNVKKLIWSKETMGMTVNEAFLSFLVGLEVLLWFFLGETIGKGHIVGYLV